MLVKVPIKNFTPSRQVAKFKDKFEKLGALAPWREIILGNSFTQNSLTLRKVGYYCVFTVCYLTKFFTVYTNDEL
jgi:hypothetical protein